MFESLIKNLKTIYTEFSLNFIFLISPFFLIIGILSYVHYNSFILYSSVFFFLITAIFFFFRNHFFQKLIIILGIIIIGSASTHLHFIQSRSHLLQNSIKTNIVAEVISVKPYIKYNKNNPFNKHDYEVWYTVILQPITIEKSSKNDSINHDSIRLIKLTSNTPLFTCDIISTNLTLQPISSEIREYFIFNQLKNISCRATLSQGQLYTKISSSTSFINKIRLYVHQKFLKILGKTNGGIASALTTGITENIIYVRNDFSRSGLAHLLAISGLHMSIIGALIFIIFSYLMTPIFLINGRKIASIITILFTFMYSILSGGSISATRAFLMTLLASIGILFYRKTILERILSLSASCILIISPEYVINPSFVLSFSAIIGLIPIIKRKKHHKDELSKSEKFFSTIISHSKSILLSSILSTFTTSIYTIYFFKQMSIYGILSNVLAIPLITFVIMPLLLLTILLMPFQSNPITSGLLEIGIQILHTIAQKFSSLSAVDFSYYDISGIEIMILTFGMLWIFLHKTNIRYCGIILYIIVFLNNIYQPNIVLNISENYIIEHNKFIHKKHKINWTKFTEIQLGQSKITINPHEIAIKSHNDRCIISYDEVRQKRFRIFIFKDCIISCKKQHDPC